ncbi:MAG: SUMF1/EgtB/PvdO family nonheme iron enzyme [candidate division KSB1 bacterium]|nr:SUMF1/EgtB/PvdO family nonheme iron enzyme [candidate division KSB1 bacterium]
MISARGAEGTLVVLAIFLASFSATAEAQQGEASPWRPKSRPRAGPDGFVLIRGGTFLRGDVTGGSARSVSRVDDFEILDHPVTHREYAEFVRQTGYPPPPFWQGQEPPAELLDHPVVMVNRYDVAAYLAWRSQAEGRTYRLPTAAEFEYAARGGLLESRYPWGDEDPRGRANYDPDGSRNVDDWKRYLRPVKESAPNGYGLFDMAGNVFQFVDTYPDPATLQYRYRLDDPIGLEGAIMGGSWNRSARYLRVGFRSSLSAGIRSPEVGFRPVRQPEGADWRTQARRVVALAQGQGRVFLSWALLASDLPEVRFNIYRSLRRDEAGFRINPKPVEATSYLDTLDPALRAAGRLYYRIRPVTPDGREGPVSEWAGVSPSESPSSVCFRAETRAMPGAIVPLFADLNGDGQLDCVVRISNGIHEMSQDPGVPVELEAFSSWGQSLWRRPLVWHDHCFGNHNNVPFNVFDLDGDGRAEVITRLQEGDSVYVAVLDGWTGRLRRKAPWPRLLSDWNRSSTRIHLSVGYLDGRQPAILTQTGVYENERITAFDRDLRPLWDFQSTGLTSGSGSHRIEVADVDGDGRQEIFDGTTCLNADGSLRWSIYRHHPDVVSIHDIDPTVPGREVFYIVETSIDAGVYLVRASDGRLLWCHNQEEDPAWTHGHIGWTADIWADSPGYECLSNRRGHEDRTLLLYSAKGYLLLEGFPFGYSPLEWDGDETRELVSADDTIVAEFDGRGLRSLDTLAVPLEGAHLLYVADLAGDFRDELVLSARQGEKHVILVLTATKPVAKRWLSRQEDLEYRLWLGRNMGGGYAQVFDLPLRRQ